MLKAFVNENRDDWDDYLPYLTMAYSATVHESTNCTPNLMMFGRENSLPIDVMMGPPPRHKDKYTCPVEYVEWLRQTMAHVHEHARQHLKTSARRQKRYYDQSANPTEYSPGQYVWRWYPPAAKQKLGKGWTGPYKVIASPTSYHLNNQQTPDGEVKKVHIDQVKPHLGRTPTIWQNHTNQTMPESQDIGISEFLLVYRNLNILSPYKLNLPHHLNFSHSL